jgi:hypothetical protein
LVSSLGSVIINLNFYQSMKIFFKKQADKAFYGRGRQGLVLKSLLVIAAVLPVYPVFAQDGNAGITQATTQVKSYFDAGTNLMYAIGAVVGIIGAVKVFNKWNAGEPDTNKVAAAWFGSCIFLVVVATVLKSFFGL